MPVLVAQYSRSNCQDSQDLEHGRLVDVPTHSHMSPVFLDELEVDALSQDLLEDTEIRTKITLL